MPEIWPAGLPQNVLVSGYSEQMGDGVIEYAPDSGPTITRAGTSAAPRPMAMAFEATSAQISILMTFVQTTLLGGSLPFSLPAPVGGGTYLVKFQKGYLPKWTALGGDTYNVAASLWILP